MSNASTNRSNYPRAALKWKEARQAITSPETLTQQPFVYLYNSLSTLSQLKSIEKQRKLDEELLIDWNTPRISISRLANKECDEQTEEENCARTENFFQPQTVNYSQGNGKPLCRSYWRLWISCSKAKQSEGVAWRNLKINCAKFQKRSEKLCYELSGSTGKARKACIELIDDEKSQREINFRLASIYENCELKHERLPA